ncbi:MAG: type 4a pilus biogenesis protein PilO [Sedimentisphaerales bacterium]|jgi:Tfp pilus assembly protein PilO
MLLREKQQLMICVAAGVMVGGFLLLRYLPLQRRTKAARQTKAAQALTIAKGTADSKQLPLLKEQLLELQRELENYEANIPEQSDIGVFLQRIAGLMNEHNLRGQVIEPRKEIKAEKLKCIPVNMRCKGRLTQIFEFYRRLQAMDRLIRIEQVKLFNDSDFGGEVGMEAMAFIYYRAEVGQG